MKHSDYWKQRFEQLEKAQGKITSQSVKEIETIYQSAIGEIEKQILVWYNRFATNNGISMKDAKKLLSGTDLKEFQWTVQEYIKHGEENALTAAYMKELENASAKFHISRLEALKVHTKHTIESLFSKQGLITASTIQAAMKSRYYHTAFEIQKGLNLGWDIAGLDDEEIEKLLVKPWAADKYNFSERIWKNKNQLISEVHSQITQNVMLGADPQKAIDSISKKMNTSKYNAGRLVMTEEAYFSSVSQKKCFEDLDVEQYQIIATLDSHTSKICQNLDGQIFDMKDFESGVTAPPFHVYCRSTTAPYFDDDFGQESYRAARDKDGKTYYVPDDMKYKDWKDKFVDGGDLSEFVEKTPEIELTADKESDIISLQDKISDANYRIESLKSQFSDITDGYSYDDWFNEFNSIEDGYGDISENDNDDFEKLKKLEQEIKTATHEKIKLLRQKDKRKQLDTGYKGKVPSEELDKFNSKALEQIKADTKYSDKQAKEFQEALQKYFGGDYESILNGNTNTAKIIRDGLDLMPIYDGSIYRGLCFSKYANGDITQFTRLKVGDKIPSKGIISSWSSNKRVAESFGSVSTQGAESSSVILECVNNETGVGVQHLSKFGVREAEVLSSADYEVLEITIESKFDYVSKRKDLLYFPNDLTDLEEELKKQIVCIIKVKEV